MAFKTTRLNARYDHFNNQREFIGCFKVVFKQCVKGGPKKVDKNNVLENVKIKKTGPNEGSNGKVDSVVETNTLVE